MAVEKLGIKPNFVINEIFSSHLLRNRNQKKIKTD